RLSQMLSNMTAKEKLQAAAELELRSTEHAAREHEATEAAIRKRLGELEIPVGSNWSTAITGMVESLQARAEGLRKAQETGESFAARIARVGDQAAIEELEREIGSAKSSVQAQDLEIRRRTATGERAQRAIEALRDAASLVVTQRVKELEPLLADMYS